MWTSWKEERLCEITNGSEVPNVIKLVIKKFLRARFSRVQNLAVSAENKCPALLKTDHFIEVPQSKSAALQTFK